MRARWMIVLFAAVTCCGTNNTQRDPNAYRGIVLRTDGPRGGLLSDPNGTELEYRIFRVHVKNDSTIPAELAIGFPGIPTRLLPDTDKFVSIFLFPDEISPDVVYDTLDFGIPGSKAFLSVRRPGPTSLRATILPGETQLLYIGVVFSPHGLNGLTRAELFIDGNTPDVSFFPKGSIPTGARWRDELNLLFGLAVDPPSHDAMIPCARITFNK